jgi:glycosyltransferase involved in cell wall biosynthesis
MKVDIIGTRGYPSFYGGFETAVRKLAPFLVDSGIDVMVYGRPRQTTSQPGLDDKRVGRRETLGMDKKSLSTLTYGLSACLLSVTRKPDVALVMNVANGFWLPLFWLFRIPTLVNVDGIEWARAKWGRLAKFVFYSGAKMTARFATHLVFDSKEIEKFWLSEFGRTGTFIPYGGDLLQPSEEQIQPDFIKGGYVLLVARFVPENTVAEFFEAVPEIAKFAQVVMVGSEGVGGPLDLKAAYLAETYANVKWLGHVADDQLLHSLWANAGVYFHGHSVGGTNPALVQAMACGAPTLARDSRFNREVLADCARYTEPYPDAIVQGVASLMANPDLRHTLGKAAISRAEAHYTWGLVNNSYLKAIGELAKAERRKAPVKAK